MGPNARQYSCMSKQKIAATPPPQKLPRDGVIVEGCACKGCINPSSSTVVLPQDQHSQCFTKCHQEPLCRVGMYDHSTQYCYLYALPSMLPLSASEEITIRSREQDSSFRCFIKQESCKSGGVKCFFPRSSIKSFTPEAQHRHRAQIEYVYLLLGSDPQRVAWVTEEQRKNPYFRVLPAMACSDWSKLRAFFSYLRYTLCVYACPPARLPARLPTCAHARTHARPHTRTCVCARICLHVRTHTVYRSGISLARQPAPPFGAIQHGLRRCL